MTVLFVVASVIVPVTEVIVRSVEFCPAATVYVPLQLVTFVNAPVLITAPVSRVIASPAAEDMLSLKLSVMLIVPPAPYVPLAVVDVALVIVGAMSKSTL